jgi:hypothetical protein
MLCITPHLSCNYHPSSKFVLIDNAVTQVVLLRCPHIPPRPLATVSCADERQEAEMTFETNASLGDRLTYLSIEVTGFTQAGVYHTVARVSCKKDNCGQDIELVSEGKETPQRVECPTHGELASFKNFAEYSETLKTAINDCNDAKGLPKIDSDAEGRFEQDN